MIPNNHFRVSLSADTLFHFTRSVDVLASILRTLFRAHYCLEDFRPLGHPLNSALEIAVPMISFCDIPLFSARTHMATYGHYGIGMKKAWGMRYHLSPVLYTYRNAALRLNLGRMINYATDNHAQPDHNQTDEIVNSFDLLSSFIKPYEGSMWRTDRYIEGVRFYDEREWRFVPDASARGLPSSLNRETYFNRQLFGRFDSRLAEIFQLEFQPDDINYLIIDNENEILPLIHLIEQVKGSYSPDIVKKLTTRIITVEQLRRDF